MGLFSFQVTSDGAGGRVTAKRGISPGILTSISVSMSRLGIDKGTILTLVRLHRGDIEANLSGAELIHDYVYTNYAPTWTGFIYTEPDDRLIVTCISHETIILHITGLTSSLMQATLGGKLVDPRPDL